MYDLVIVEVMFSLEGFGTDRAKVLGACVHMCRQMPSQESFTGENFLTNGARVTMAFHSQMALQGFGARKFTFTFSTSHRSTTNIILLITLFSKNYL